MYSKWVVGNSTYTLCKHGLFSGVYTYLYTLFLSPSIGKPISCHVHLLPRPSPPPLPALGTAMVCAARWRARHSLWQTCLCSALGWYVSSVKSSIQFNSYMYSFKRFKRFILIGNHIRRRICSSSQHTALYYSSTDTHVHYSSTDTHVFDFPSPARPTI